MRHSSLLHVLAGTAWLTLAACSSDPPPRQEAANAPPPAPAADLLIAQAQLHRNNRSPGLNVAEPMAMYEQMVLSPPVDREIYGQIDANPVQRVAENPVSTFSIDVDTGAYSNVRRMLNAGRLPPQDAVRVEELINYFDYEYAVPQEPAKPFRIATEIAPTPWNPKTKLLHIGMQGWKPQHRKRASNLVFLVDVSGSMQDEDKLPLVKSSLKLLVRTLSTEDRISLVVYAGNTGVVLEPTPGDDRATIESALQRLEAGGSTNGGAGIALAYAMAEKAFMKDGNNRVLLATDGDFNVGTVNFEALVDLVEDKRKSGVALTTLGFGTGNYNDYLMEQLADAGNGNHAYIDTLAEAQRVLVSQREATLHTIAKDVKIQVEFNPAAVAEYRLIGYENRILRREDFSNDHVDAGEIGSGHEVTALYEIALIDSGGERIDPLRYSGPAPTANGGGELAFLRLRYKRPEDGMRAGSRLIEQPIGRNVMHEDAGQASRSFRLAAAVAAYGQLLQGSEYLGHYTYEDVATLAESAAGVDPATSGFLDLVRLAGSLSTRPAGEDTGGDRPKVAGGGR